MNPIYADYNASTPMLSVVKEYLTGGRLNGPYANPNSLHHQGHQLSVGIEQCRNIIAGFFSISSSQVIFNSGSSESIASVFWMTIGKAILTKSPRTKIICSVIEHAAVIEQVKFWQKWGATVEWIECHENGIIDLNSLEKTLQTHQESIALVAMMAANNETGAIQPYAEVNALCQKFQLSYLCDTTQLIGKKILDLSQYPNAFFCSSAHKLGAPLGSGFLITPKQENVFPLIHGGGQEHGHRGGTQNYLGIEAMTVALDWHHKNISTWKNILAEKIKFEGELKKLIPSCFIIAQTSERLPNTTLVAFPKLHSQGLQIELESRNVFVTTSAACSDNEPHTSRVLRAMHINDDAGRSVLRISTGLEFDLKNYSLMAQSIQKSVAVIQKIKI